MRAVARFVFLLLLTTYFLSPVHLLAESLSVSLTVGETQISFDGFTSPDAFITIMQNNVVIGTTAADSSGNFTKTINADSPGIQSFELYASDTNSVVSPTITYSVNLTPATLTSISNIVFPPTINPPTLPETVGDPLTLSGLTHPLSTLTLLVSDGSTYNVTPIGDGTWTITITTSSTAGSYTTYLTATMPGSYISLASETISYTLVGISSSSSDSPSSSETPSPTSSPSLLDNSAATTRELATPSSSPKPLEILETFAPARNLSTQAVQVITLNSLIILALLLGTARLLRLIYISRRSSKLFFIVYLVARPILTTDKLIRGGMIVEMLKQSIVSRY